MSRVDSRYERRPDDLYETPAWVTEALIPHLPQGIRSIWEPAAGSGKIVQVLIDHGYSVYASDIVGGDDFLQATISERPKQGQSASNLGAAQGRNREALFAGEGFSGGDGEALRGFADGLRPGAAKAKTPIETKVAHRAGSWPLYRRQPEHPLSPDGGQGPMQSLRGTQSVGDPSHRWQPHEQCPGQSGGPLLPVPQPGPQERVLGQQTGCGIVSNPPFALATSFIEHALSLTFPDGFVAMLLAADFDSAKGRRHLFADCPQFACTVVLTQRIVWFERKDGKKAAPSENHRWFIWSWRHTGPPTIAYAP